MSTTNKPTKQAASQAASQLVYYKVRESGILRGMIVVYVYLGRERVAVYSLADFLNVVEEGA